MTDQDPATQEAKCQWHPERKAIVELRPAKQVLPVCSQCLTAIMGREGMVGRYVVDPLLSRIFTGAEKGAISSIQTSIDPTFTRGSNDGI